MIGWKIPAGFAGCAIILAFIAGAIAGIPFGTLLFRALLSGIIFGIIGYGVMFVFKRWFPDLYGVLSPGAGKGEIAEGIDIVISDESETPAPVSTEMPDAVIAAPETETISDSADDLVEEVQEMGKESVSPPDSGDDHANLEELPAQGNAKGDFPELDSMEDTFDKFGGTGELSDISSKDAESVQVMGDFQDPKDVARAVQTMMKKDEE